MALKCRFGRTGCRSVTANIIIGGVERTGHGGDTAWS